MEPTSTQKSTLSEVDNIDVFDFFNLPRLAETSSRSDGGQTSCLLSHTPNGLGSGSLPDPEHDWLRYGTPYS